MIDFRLSDEQQALKDTVRKFVERDMIPVASRYDESGEFPREIVNKAWELGLMNLPVPIDFGGLGLGVMEDVIVSEELGAGCLGMCTSICVNTLALYPILLFGTKEQIDRLVTAHLCLRPDAACAAAHASGKPLQASLGWLMRWARGAA